MIDEKIRLAHGSGGKLTHQLIQEIIVKNLTNPILKQLEDSAVFSPEVCHKNEKIAFTTDSYVIDPVFFPGGDIGKLAVCGTVNDLAMSGAVPKYLSLSLIIEEGLSFKDFKKIIASIKKTVQEAKVKIIAGDTKVVEKGSADKIFINTSGIGFVPRGIKISSASARPGDVVIINGSIGDHGMAIMAQRQELGLRTRLNSDCSPLNSLTGSILKASKKVHTMRDLTRGGLATVLNEIASASKTAIELDQASIPVKDKVKAVCQILGFDPLYVANEGKMVVIVPRTEAGKILRAMKKNKYGKRSCVIGILKKTPQSTVLLKTVTGGRRIVDMLTGGQLPRIC